jgi:hypothetical protein
MKMIEGAFFSASSKACKDKNVISKRNRDK